MNRLFPIVISAVLLAGCTMAPDYERPASPVAASWPDKTPDAQTQSAADIGWKSFFGDARLQKLIELALANNRDLRISVLNIEQARAQYRIQRADLLPTLEGTANATRQRLPSDLSGTGQSGMADQYSVGLGATAFELDLFGRVRSLKDSALSQYLSTVEARRSAQISLIGELANAYLVERAADEQLELVRRTLATRETSYDLIKRRYASGISSELDLRQSETLVQSARADLAGFERQRKQARNALELLVGQPLSADLPKAQPLHAQSLLADISAGLPSQLIERRPDILAAEQKLQAENANIGAARAAFFPRISLTGAFGTASTELSGLFDAGSSTWSFMPQISLPIFDMGRNAASLDVAEVRKNIAVAEYEKTIQSAFREVADGLAARATLDGQIKAQEAAVDASRRSFELSDYRYRKGIDNYLALLDAQRSLFSAEQLLIQARLLRLTSLVDLYRALGGGWLEHDAASASGEIPQL